MSRYRFRRPLTLVELEAGRGGGVKQGVHISEREGGRGEGGVIILVDTKRPKRDIYPSYPGIKGPRGVAREDVCRCRRGVVSGRRKGEREWA